MGGAGDWKAGCVGKRRECANTPTPRLVESNETASSFLYWSSPRLLNFSICQQERVSCSTWGRAPLYFYPWLATSPPHLQNPGDEAGLQSDSRTIGQ